MQGIITLSHDLRTRTVTVSIHEATGPNRTLFRTGRCFHLTPNQYHPQDNACFRRYILRLFKLGLGECCYLRDQYWVPPALREVGMANRGWLVEEKHSDYPGATRSGRDN